MTSGLKRGVVRINCAHDEPKVWAAMVENLRIAEKATGRSARILADPGSQPAALTRPGHVFPLRAVKGGVRERPGHTEAAVELCRLAGLETVGVIAEVVHDNGEMMRLDGLRGFAREHGCPLVSIADLVAYLEAGQPAGPTTDPV